MSLLLLSVVALLLGPVFAPVVRRSRWASQLVDGFVIVGVLGLTLGHILPHTVAQMGVWTWPAWLLGLLLPTYLHGAAKPCASHEPGGVLVVAVVALGLHALLDGVALVEVYRPDVGLAAGVVLHRLLEGVSVWWLTQRSQLVGRIAALVGLAGASVLGFWLGSSAVLLGLSPMVALIQAGVAGSLLHVLARHPELDSPSGATHALCLRLMSGAGGLLALALLLSEGEALEPSGAHPALHAHPHLGGGAPPLLPLAIDVGALLATGLVLVALGHALAVRRQSFAACPQAMLRAAVRGAWTGMGTALCSCGVIPLLRQRQQRGASGPESVAFLLAAPALGPLGLTLSLALLGPRLTLVRIVAVGVIAIVSALLFGRVPAPHLEHRAAQPLRQAPRRLGPALRDGAAFAGGDVLNYTAPWLLSALAGVPLLHQLVQPSWLMALEQQAWLLLLLATLLVPIYIAAEAASVVAVALAVLGGGQRLALTVCLGVGLLSWVSLAELRSLLGTRRAVGVATAVLVGIACVTQLLEPAALDHPVLGVPSSLTYAGSAWGALGLALIVVAALRQGVRGSLDRLAAPNRHDDFGVHHEHV